MTTLAGAKGEESGEASRWAPPRSVLPPVEERLVLLMEEFRRRQRERPDLVVRPWWTTGTPDPGRATIGFVVEYCPAGSASAELRIRADRVTVEGPSGSSEARLDLTEGWVMGDRDAGSPEILANLMLNLASGTLVA